MISGRDIFGITWVSITGLACIALPYVWWPRPFSRWTLLHAVIFALAVIGIAFAGRAGAAFDRRKSRVRGYTGLIAYSAVTAGSIFAYRWLVL